MNITLISPYTGIANLGLRTISACLKKAGHNVKMVFLFSHPFEPLIDYTPKLFDEIFQLCSDSRLVGITLMSGHFDKAVQLTNAIKGKLNIPVIWGGIHPTTRPLECLQYADIVCIGEGEEALVELAYKMEADEDYFDIKNLWFKADGKVKRNDVRPLIQHLDPIPFMDYDIDEHYIYDGRGSLLPMTKDILKERMATMEVTLIPGTAAYQTMWIRGCPYKCTYCCNDIYHALYKGQRLVRKRSPKNIVEEIKRIKDEFDFITNVWFHDDSFFAASKEDIKEFCELYKKEISLPFYVLGDPLLTTDEKLSMAVDAGLHTLQIGIESGSNRIIELYNRRRFKPENTLKLGEVINKFKDKIRVVYDIIVDNPYETYDDILDTIRMLLKMPYPYTVQRFSLILFPETGLYRKAKEDGLLKDKTEVTYKKGYYKKIKPSYLNLVFFLLSINLPKPIIKFMITPPMLFIFNRRWFNFLLLLASKGVWLPLKEIKTSLRGSFPGLGLGLVKRSTVNVGNKSIHP